MIICIYFYVHLFFVCFYSRHIALYGYYILYKILDNKFSLKIRVSDRHINWDIANH